MNLNMQEPIPTRASHSKAVWPHVWADLEDTFLPQEATERVIRDAIQRDQAGVGRYGTTLMTFNGRNALVDVYQEMLDGLVYLKQTLLEGELSEDHQIQLERVYNDQLLAVVAVRQIIYETTGE